MTAHAAHGHRNVTKGCQAPTRLRILYNGSSQARSRIRIIYKGAKEKRKLELLEKELRLKKEIVEREIELEGVRKELKELEE